MLNNDELELYIHIPFCIRKCNYCDFLSFPSDEITRQKYVDALKKEIIETGKVVKGKRIRSIFFGGGTPSVLSIAQTHLLMEAIQHSFNLMETTEVSTEVNPGTLDKEKLNAYKKMGFNRLSMGLQSSEDSCLKTLGRIHTYEVFLENYKTARDSGFENINIDLMSALPGQTLKSYEKTLHSVAKLSPEHISAYSLILEEGTPFYQSEEVQSALPEEDEERAMYESTKKILEQYGYHRYEISNYAKEGKECIHNLGYWDNVPYIGMGLGASSYYNNSRFSNEDHIRAYMEEPFVSFAKRKGYYILDEKEQMEEYMFLGLRKIKGISFRRFYERFHINMEEVYGDVMKKYCEMGLLERKKDILRLTEAGIDVSNLIFSDFLL